MEMDLVNKRKKLLFNSGYDENTIELENKDKTYIQKNIQINDIELNDDNKDIEIYKKTEKNGNTSKLKIRKIKLDSNRSVKRKNDNINQNKEISENPIKIDRSERTKSIFLNNKANQ